MVFLQRSSFIWMEECSVFSTCSWMDQQIWTGRRTGWTMPSVSDFPDRSVMERRKIQRIFFPGEPVSYQQKQYKIFLESVRSWIIWSWESMDLSESIMEAEDPNTIQRIMKINPSILEWGVFPSGKGNTWPGVAWWWIRYLTVRIKFAPWAGRAGRDRLPNMQDWFMINDWSDLEKGRYQGWTIYSFAFADGMPKLVITKSTEYFAICKLDPWLNIDNRFDVKMISVLKMKQLKGWNGCYLLGESWHDAGQLTWETSMILNELSFNEQYSWLLYW